MAELYTEISSADLNDLTTQGKYYVLLATANYPSTFNQYLLVEVIKWGINIVQRVYAAGEINGFQFTRKYTSYHKWTLWI